METNQGGHPALWLLSAFVAGGLIGATPLGFLGVVAGMAVGASQYREDPRRGLITVFVGSLSGCIGVIAQTIFRL